MVCDRRGVCGCYLEISQNVCPVVKSLAQDCQHNRLDKYQSATEPCLFVYHNPLCLGREAARARLTPIKKTEFKDTLERSR